MFVAFPGFIIPAGSGFPAAGAFISDECTFADGNDASNTYWSGEWNYSVTRADGAGGSYDNVEGSNTNGCYIPAGYVYSNSSLESYFSWNHGPYSGIFHYGYSDDYTYSDGIGGTAGGSGNTITAVDGTVVNSYGFADTYPMTSYLKFLVSDTSQLHVFNYIDAGTDIGSSCAYSNYQDAQGTVWPNVNYRLTAYADGNGGSYYGPNDYNTMMCGYLPSGFWESYSSSDRVLTYYDEYSNQQTFTYGQDNNGYIATGSGGSNWSDTGSIYYSAGYVFYSYYDSVYDYTVNYAFDGSSGHYTYPS